jgi:glycogenin glucosyltransferase
MKTYCTAIFTDDYLLGALAMHKSLVATEPGYDLLAVLTKNVSPASRRALDRSGIKTLTLDREFTIPTEARATNTTSGVPHWNNTLSKLLIFDLTQYEKIVFLDADMMVMQNLDHLFQLPHMSALVADKLCHEHWVQLNAGLMVIEPKVGLADSIFFHLSALQKTGECFGMEPLLHAHYPNWPERTALHLDQKYNVFFGSVESYVNKHGYNLNWKSPDDKTIAVLHFWGSQKLWNLSARRQLKWILKEFAKRNFALATVLWRYCWLINSVRNGEPFGNGALRCLIRLLENPASGGLVVGRRRFFNLDDKWPAGPTS